MASLDNQTLKLFRDNSIFYSFIIYFILSIFLISSDIKFQLNNYLQKYVSIFTYPIQFVFMQPIKTFYQGKIYFQNVEYLIHDNQKMQKKLAINNLKINEAKKSEEENQNLRKILELKPKLELENIVSQVIYEIPNKYYKKVMIDKGLNYNLNIGNIVINEFGLVGLITKVLEFNSEVTLLIDNNFSIPVKIERNNLNTLLYSNYSSLKNNNLKIPYLVKDTDIKVNDILVTNELNNFYLPDIPVAKVINIKNVESSVFMQIECESLVKFNKLNHVIILNNSDNFLIEKENIKE